MSQDSQTQIYLDVTERVVWIRDAQHEHNMDTFESINVPPDVNIFKLLMIQQPQEVTNISNWKVSINPNHAFYPNISGILEAIRYAQWSGQMPDDAYNLLLGLYLPVMFLGTTLNLFLLWALLTTKKLRTEPRNSFILALAISDFFLCNFTCPLTLWATLEGHWPLGANTNILCKFVKAGQDFPIIMSSFCIGAIACDRFRYIVQGHLTQMTATQGFLFSILLALIGSSFVAPVFFTAGLTIPAYMEDTYFCDVDWPKEHRYHYMVITTAAHYFLTLFIVILLYTKIYLRLRSRPPSQHEEVNRRRRRTNILLASITIIFFIGWSPMVIFCFIHDLANHLLPEKIAMQQFAYAIALLFGMLTPIANPILYSLLNESFRSAVSEKCVNKCLRSRQPFKEEVNMELASGANGQDLEDEEATVMNLAIDTGERQIVTKRRSQVSNVKFFFNATEDKTGASLVEANGSLEAENGGQKPEQPLLQIKNIV